MKRPNHAAQQAAARQVFGTLIVLCCAYALLATFLVAPAIRTHVNDGLAEALDLYGGAVLIFGLITLVYVIRWRRALRRTIAAWTDRKCMQCGYSLVGHATDRAPDRCPECGRTNPGSYHSK